MTEPESAGILEALEEKVVELEEVVLDEKFIHETTSRIYHLKRELLSIKRAVSPLVDICSRLMRLRDSPCGHGRSVRRAMAGVQTVGLAVGKAAKHGG